MDYDGNTKNIKDKHGHGTHIAGIIDGDSSVTSGGIAPRAKMVAD